jgi:hypothetical protein
MVSKVASLAAPLAAVLFVAHRNLASSSEQKAKEEPQALFTHDDNELHCMDRTLVHPCVSELKAHIDNKTDDASRKVALDCVNGILEMSNSYLELKNMTHLLLDLDTNKHAFDGNGDSRDNDFIQTGLKFAKKLTEHPECLKEFDTKNDLECRCKPLYTKISMLKMKNAGWLDQALELFDEAKKFEWKGETRSYGPGEAIKWDHWQHTPQIWLPGIRSMEVWPRDTWADLPITKVLEDNFPTILEETQLALQNESSAGFSDAYRFLYEKGQWDHVLLYNGRKFRDECKVFPKTCDILRKHLPSKNLPWVSDQNEQAMIIKMKKGTDVETHSGPANNILNIHLGITGDLKNAKLIVANKTYSWEEGKVLAWDGSFDHRVHCLDCTEDRIIMMVRYMHPDVTEAHFKGIDRTHFEDVPVELQ